jgi:SAM-dependent methyltransferase
MAVQPFMCFNNLYAEVTDIMLGNKTISMVNDYFSEGDLIDEYNERVKRGLLGWEKTVVGDYMAPPGSVLDVGCGCGREAFALYDLGYQVIGVDLSEKQIEQAKKNALGFNKEIDFRVCDGISYDFADSSFDYVIIWQQVLGNIPAHINRVGVLREARRVLKPHGKIIVSVHSYEYCMPVVEEKGLLVSTGEEERDFILKEPYGNVCYWHYFTKDEFEQHFIEAGIDILRCDYATAFGMPEGWETIMVCVGEKI